MGTPVADPMIPRRRVWGMLTIPAILLLVLLQRCCELFVSTEDRDIIHYFQCDN